MCSGDDGYEQISSDEEDLESGAFKLPSFDVDYTAEDLASVPSVQYDPYERELRPLQHFTPPQTTQYEAQLSCLKNQDLDDPTSAWAESAAKLTELLESGTSVYVMNLSWEQSDFDNYIILQCVYEYLG